MEQYQIKSVVYHPFCCSSAETKPSGTEQDKVYCNEGYDVTI